MRIFSDSNILIDYYEGNQNILNVTFSGYTSLKDRQPFGYNLSSKLNHSSLIITARHNHYYFDNSILIGITNILNKIGKYKKICMYGCGMGGYAALKFSKIFNANTVFLISPLIGDTYEKIYTDEKYINKNDVCGEIFLLYDDKNSRDRKNFEFLSNLCAINAYKLSNAGHIAFYALKELDLLEMLFMGRGEIGLSKFFIEKLKMIFDEKANDSAIVFCNIFPSLNETEKNNYISKLKNINLTNYKSDLFHKILASYYKKEEDLFYLQALDAEKNDRTRAVDLYLKALEINNEKGYWKFQLARNLAHLKQFETSIKYYSEAIDFALCDPIYKNFITDWSNRVAKLYEKIGKRNEARKYYSLGVSYDSEKTTNHELRLNLNTNEFDETKRIIQFVSDVIPLCKDKIKGNNHEGQVSNLVFVYWAQGFDQAPDLVKKCLSSIINYSKDLDLVLLNDENLEKYLEIPSYIKQKFLAGEIGYANYSDILRIMLLKKFGGAWIDATCLLTQELKPVMSKMALQSDFFAFMYEKPMISSWFLISKKFSYVTDLFESVVLEYWNSYLGHSYYFYFHAIFYSLYILDEDFRMEIDKSLYISTKIPHALQFNMMKNYNLDEYSSLINGCFIHKLTYKYDINKVSGTHLEKILKG